MELHWADLLALVLYFVIVFAVGFWATCRANTGNSSGYFLAGQNSNWILTGTSTFATNVGAPMFVGLAGSAAANGIAPVMFEWHAIFMLLALGWLFLPVYRASGCFTMPQYLKLRYGGNRICLIISVVVLINSVVALISGQMYAGALFIQQIFQWNLYLSVGLVLVVTALYTVIGGLTAVLWTDAIQTVILVIGSILLSVTSMNKIGGFEAIRERFGGAMANYTYVDQALYGNRSCGVPSDNAWHIFRPYDAGDYPWPGLVFGLTILAINAWCTDQLCVQRSLSAKSISHAKAGVILAGYLKILPFVFFILPGMVSRILYPDEIGCADPDKCYAICGNAKGCTNIAYPLLVIRILPNGVRGIMLAALLAALMSSLTSIFNSASTVFTLDLWTFFRKNASENELMVVGRVFTIVLVFVSVGWLPFFQATQGGQFWDYVQSIQSHILPPIVSCFVMGIFWTRTTELAAFSGLVIGFLIGLLRLALTWVQSAPICGSGDPDTRWPIIAKVHYLHFAIILMVISMVIMVVVSFLTEPRSEKQLRRVTYWTRMSELPDLEYDTKDDSEERKSNSELTEEEGKHNLEPTEESSYENMLCQEEMNENGSKQKSGVVTFLKKYVCGFEVKKKKILTRSEQRQLQIAATNIEEDPFWGTVMDGVGIFTFGVAVFLHTFWA